jgi:actin-related protein 8
MPPKKAQDPNAKKIRFTSFHAVAPINQKNFYTDYLKSDSQFYAHRLFVEHTKRVAQLKKEKLAEKAAEKTEAAAAPPKKDDDEENEDGDEDESPEERATLGAKSIVVHLGSRDLRIGLASHAYPKTVPCVIARRTQRASQPQPVIPKDAVTGPGLFGAEFEADLKKLSTEVKHRMRNTKRRMIPNGPDLVSSFNGRSQPVEIVDHNDPARVEWTDTSDTPEYITGQRALRIEPEAQPHYELFWPIQHGTLNEAPYKSRQQLLGDLVVILTRAIEDELKVPQRSFKDYAFCLVIPDLYDRAFVENLMQLAFAELSFAQVLLLQESVCATYGAGISSACVVDVGAQKTSVSCVEEGICVGDSRILLNYGGDDITALFTKTLLRASFPYRDFDLSRTYDWMLAEDLKAKFCSVNEADVAVQLYHFYQRQPGRATRKYDFKVYDEQVMVTLAYFYPKVFGNKERAGRRSLFPKSVDIYEGHVNEPDSVVQTRFLFGKADREPNGNTNPTNRPGAVVSTLLSAKAATATETAATDTPMEVDSPNPAAAEAASMAGDPVESAIDKLVQSAREGDDPTLMVPLDQAIIASIECACENLPMGTEERKKALFSTILITGAGFNLPYASTYLADRLRALRPGVEKIDVVPAPKELDPQVLSWKGMSIFSRIKIASEFMITAHEYELLGCRAIQSKCLGYFWQG